MSTVQAVDTNVLVRLFVKDSPDLLAKSRNIVDRSEAGGLLLDRLIMAELNYVLKSVYGYSKNDRLLVLESVLADEHFSVIDRELVEVTLSLFASEKPLSFEDCWLLALKRSGKVKSVATFDADLQKRL